MMPLPDLSEAQFLKLSDAEVGAIVRRHGPATAVLPVNGTRRWFVLERGIRPGDDYAQAFVEAVAEQTLRLAQLILDHGVANLVMPVYGTDLATRGIEYQQMAVDGLAALTAPAFRAFYDAVGVRVRFYGDYRMHFAGFSALLDAMAEVEADTADHTAHLLLYGVCGESATRAITAAAAERGRVLTEAEAIEVYYGAPVSQADVFIGFGRPTAFDMPLLDAGGVDLYFTVAPSPYIDAGTLRRILYDWIWVRSKPDIAYGELRAHHWEHMGSFYSMHRRSVEGTGFPAHGIWYARPGAQVAEG